MKKKLLLTVSILISLPLGILGESLIAKRNAEQSAASDLINAAEGLFFPKTLLCAIVLSVCIFITVYGISSLFFTLRGGLKEYGRTFKKYQYLMSNLVTKDIKVKYRRSVLGVLWSVLNPFLMMLVITAVFQNIFRFDIEHFPIYYLTGSLLYNFVIEATSSAMTSVIYAGPLIRKVYIPKYVFPLEKCLFSCVNMLFSSIAIIAMTVILQFQMTWTALLFPIPMLYAFVFSVGLGMILSSLYVFFRDIGHLYGVLTTAWFYLTPIIYPLDILPRPITELVKLNPLYYYIEYFRQVIMYGTIPSLNMNLICAATAIFTLLMGVLIFKKQQDRFILYL